MSVSRPGVRVFECSPACSPRVEIWSERRAGEASAAWGASDAEHGAADAGAAPEADVEREWARLRGLNPRLFDGPILSAVDPSALGRGVLVCRRDGYKNYAAGLALGRGPVVASVTGFITATDGAGEPRVLVARRGRETWMYPGAWELAPSGVLEPPPAGQEVLEMADLVLQLERELVEETGLALRLPEPRLVLAYEDPRARSIDLVIASHLGAAPRWSAGASAGHAWEVDSVRWLTRDEARGLVAGALGPVTPGTPEVLGRLGWAGGPVC